MKRKISIFLMAVLLITALASPVSASEVSYDNAINILEYATANDSGTNYVKATVAAGSVDAKYDLRQDSLIRYVDILINVGQGTIGTVKCGSSGRQSTLTLVNVGGNLYRAYGMIPLASATLIVTISNGSGATVDGVFEILTFNGYGQDKYEFADTGFFAVSNEVSNSSFIYMEDSDTPAYYYFRDVDTSLDPVGRDYLAYFYPENWKKYDRIDMYMKFRVQSITSISVNLDGKALPFELSMFDLTSDSWIPTNVYGYDAPLYITGSWSSTDYVYIMLSFEIDSIDRKSSTTPQITVTGQYTESVLNQHIGLMSVTGIVKSSGMDADAYWLRWLYKQLSYIDQHMVAQFTNLSGWISNQTTAITEALASGFYDVRLAMSTHFQQLKGWLQTQTSTLEAAIRGDSSPGDSFQDDVAEKDQQFNDMAAVMDSVNKPSLDSINVNVDQYVAPADITLLTSPLLVFLTGDIFGPIIIMTLILATVSYVLYGKRG